MNKDSLEFHIHCPPYHSKLRLMAMDLTDASYPMIEISQAFPKNGAAVTVQVPEKTLESKLQKGHHYRWVLISSEYPEVRAYSEALFHW